MTEHPMPVRTIRLMLVADEGLCREIVHAALKQQPDLELIDEVRSCQELERALERSPADLVIWAVNGLDMPRACPSIFDRYRRLKVLMVRDDGRRSFLWELRPTPRALGELSPQHLVAVIREECVR